MTGSDHVSARVTGRMSACDRCLRRSWLIGSLAARIEVAADRQRSPVESVLALSDEELIEALGGGSAADLTSAYRDWESSVPRAALDGLGTAYACVCDDAYPEGLRDLPDPPAVLYALGRARVLAAQPDAAVAVVGARRATTYGLEVARTLGRGLGLAGLTVVSGMALGVDSAAHEGTLDAGAPGVAVLAGDVTRPYPASKRALHARLREHGCVVSELPPGAQTHRWCFVARNRIIAALAGLTVVVEAAERSGSLITAARARDLGRDVGAVPGRITTRTADGTNALIADGALVVRRTEDVLDAMLGAGVESVARYDPLAGLEPRLRDLLDAVEDGRNSVSALAEDRAEIDAVREGLLELELLGLVARDAAGRYRRMVV